MEKNPQENFAEAMENLRLRSDPEEIGNLDTIQLELEHRSLEVELDTKRKQVRELREEVDTQVLQVHELKKKLSEAESKVTSLEAELEATKSSFAAADMVTQAKLLAKKEIEQISMATENSKLKEMLRRSEGENRKLRREVEDSKAQQINNATNVKQLLGEDQKIRNMMEKYANTLEDVEKEKEKITHLCEKLKVFQNYEDQIQFLNDQNKKKSKAYDDLEEKYVFNTAKLRTLEELVASYKLPVPPTSICPVESYYQGRAADLERHLDTERDILLQHHERLQMEKQANIFLSEKVFRLESQVECLERQLGNNTPGGNPEKVDQTE